MQKDGGIRADNYAFTESSDAYLQCLVNRDLLNKSSRAGSSKNPDKREERRINLFSSSDCVALLEAFERAGTPRHVDGRFTWREMRMKNTVKALLAASGAVAIAFGIG